ncbi:MAG: hypothetical protein Q8M26_03805 [Pseudolabrys sp.]|nr:hypothetical protein [Pseudolabrys sp.]
MLGEHHRRGSRIGARAIVLLGGALALAACGSSSLLSTSPLDMFSSSSKATNTNPGAAATAAAPATDDLECPSVDVRTGAATLVVGSKPGDPAPAALDVRYQGTILRTARECQVNAGVMTMKVGVEGRIITGPAGAPGTVDVPLRLAVVQEGPNPKTIVSKLARVPVTVSSAVDRVVFTHVDSEITFPLPQPLGLIDAYIVYVGFDPVAPPERRRPAPRKR